jgi:hypothetical protein
LKNATTRRPTTSHRLARTAAALAGVLTALLSTFVVASSASAADEQGVKGLADAITVNLAPDGSPGFLMTSEETSKDGEFYRTFTSQGARVGVAYPSDYAQNVQVSYVLQTTSRSNPGPGDWTTVPDAKPVTFDVQVSGDQKQSLESADFPLPYQYTNLTGSYRIVFEATWTSPADGAVLYQKTLAAPVDAGRVACDNQWLTCTENPGGWLDV